MRMYSCYDCSHKLRFGASRCGRCYTETPFYNRRAFNVLLALLIVVIAIALLISAAS